MSESGIVEERGALRDARREGATALRADHLARGFGALIVLVLALIVLGALVRAHEAGLACPDWPLCFGEFVPQINLEVAFEWSHRLLAGSVALLFAGLTAVTLRAAPIPPGTRRLLAVATALLLVQVLLGALTVWQLLAPWTVTSHLVTANAFVVTLLLISCNLQEGGHRITLAAPATTRVRAWISLAALLLVAQIALGGLVSSRYAGLACPEWPTCNGGLWFPTWRGTVGLQLLHRMNAYLLIGALAVAAGVSWRIPRLREAMALALALGLVQLAVGVGNVLLGLPVEVTGLHTGLASTLVLSVALATWRVWRGPGAVVAAR
jgi:cytochrome c oxidase assembly protein subunit 15